MKRGVIISLLLVIFLISCSPPPAKEIPADAVKVDMKDFKFGPETITIKAGQTIAWANQDTASHTATAKDGSWTTAELFKGQADVAKFDKPGTYEYYCAIHPRMKGKVIVE